MAPGIRSLSAAVSLTGALLLTPLPNAVAVGTPSPGPPSNAAPSGLAHAHPSSRADLSLPTEPSLRTGPSLRTDPSRRTDDPSAARADASPQAVSEDQHLAGSRAGEGRRRPGRVEPQQNLDPYAFETVAPDEVAPAQDAGNLPPSPQVQPPEPADPSLPQPPPTPAPTPDGALPPPRHHHRQPQALPSSSDLRAHVLSLGAGLTLTGLGLGFLALRLRRP
ncbi:hypothetical protein [Streptomyces sp. NPDC007172]|uniref:hypothetical protein n=1 Tax=Streptomyces sp. NPDC007172 TaxID=3364776 RepID=UPI00369B69F7